MTRHQMAAQWYGVQQSEDRSEKNVTGMGKLEDKNDELEQIGLKTQSNIKKSSHTLFHFDIKAAVSNLQTEILSFAPLSVKVIRDVSGSPLCGGALPCMFITNRTLHNPTLMGDNI